VQTLCETTLCFLNIELPYFPAIPLLSIPKIIESRDPDTCTPMFIAALFSVVQMCKQPKCPSTCECIKQGSKYKWWLLFSLKKEWNSQLANG
jgi:hypothetical protein